MLHNYHRVFRNHFRTPPPKKKKKTIASEFIFSDKCLTLFMSGHMTPHLENSDN